jgi:hypothetical protein
LSFCGCCSLTKEVCKSAASKSFYYCRPLVIAGEFSEDAFDISKMEIKRFGIGKC